MRRQHRPSDETATAGVASVTPRTLEEQAGRACRLSAVNKCLGLKPRLPPSRAGVRTARAWNVMGTLLLVNITLIALLSAPSPWRVFWEGSANAWIGTAPYIWLPTVMAFAILGHIVIYRRLRAGRD